MHQLQINPYTIQTTVLQYGILGIVAVLLGYFAWSSYKRLIDRNDALEKKVDALQDEMTGLLLEERDRMGKIVEENTRAINDLRAIIVNTLIQNKREA